LGRRVDGPTSAYHVSCHPLRAKEAIMAHAARITYLRIALVCVGLIAIVCIYPLMVLWP
jgi:hypothetical protein